MPPQTFNHHHQVGWILLSTWRYSNQYVNKMVVLEWVLKWEQKWAWLSTHEKFVLVHHPQYTPNQFSSTNQRFNKVIKLFNKLAIIITQAKEGFQSTNILWLKNMWNGFNLDFLNPQSTYINHDPNISLEHGKINIFKNAA
jgi:hypothetical protein